MRIPRRHLKDSITILGLVGTYGVDDVYSGPVKTFGMVESVTELVDTEQGREEVTKTTVILAPRSIGTDESDRPIWVDTTKIVTDSKIVIGRDERWVSSVEVERIRGRAVGVILKVV